LKWFKHISDSADDPDIDDSMTLFGSDGYVVYFRTLEVMAREFDIENPGISTFSVSFYKKKFRISYKKLTKILKFFEKRKRFLLGFSQEDGLDMITINCPKLKDMCDEYTKKLLKEMSGQTPDKLRRIEEEVEEEVEEEKKRKDEPEKTPVPKINKLGSWIDENPGMKIYLSRFEKNSWPKIKTAIGEALKKNKHPIAIKDLIIYIHSRNDIEDPQTYFWKTINIVSGNYYAKTAETDHKAIKTQEIPDLKKIFDKMFSGINGKV